MAVSLTNSTTGPYTGDGTTVAFAISFAFIDNDQVFARLTDTITGAISEWTQGTEFTVTGGDPGTHVTATTAPTTDETLEIYRSTPQTQEAEYDDTGAFPAATHELTLDRMVMMIQEMQDQIDAIDNITADAGDGPYVRQDLQSVAAGGIVTVGANQRIVKTVIGTSAARTADPTTPIEAPTIDCQELLLCGTSDTNTLTIPAGGNVACNGDCTLGLDDSILLLADLTNAKWLEIARTA